MNCFYIHHFFPQHFKSFAYCNERSWQFIFARKTWRWRPSCDSMLPTFSSPDGSAAVYSLRNKETWINEYEHNMFQLSDIGIFPSQHCKNRQTPKCSYFFKHDWPGPVRENPSTKHRESMRIDLGRWFLSACRGCVSRVGILGKVVQSLQGVAVSFWGFVLRVGISWGFWVSCCMRWFLHTGESHVVEPFEERWSKSNSRWIEAKWTKHWINIEDCFHNATGIFIFTS